MMVDVLPAVDMTVVFPVRWMSPPFITVSATIVLSEKFSGGVKVGLLSSRVRIPAVAGLASDKRVPAAVTSKYRILFFMILLWLVLLFAGFFEFFDEIR